VPVVTFDGDRWASRTSVSLLRAAGLDEFVAPDRQGYVDLCEGLANAADLADRLQGFRAGVRERLRRSPVCDAAAFARDMEALYFRLWEERAGG
jgi:predicted O-linked N-acetylglucosamine transferase (SPINDLY family)